MILSMALRNSLKVSMEVLVMTPSQLARDRKSLIAGPVSMVVMGTTPSQVARLWALPIILFMEATVMTSSMQVMEITGSMVILGILETISMIGGGD